MKGWSGASRRQEGWTGWLGHSNLGLQLARSHTAVRHLAKARWPLRWGSIRRAYEKHTRPGPQPQTAPPPLGQVRPAADRPRGARRQTATQNVMTSSLCSTTAGCRLGSGTSNLRQRAGSSAGSRPSCPDQPGGHSHCPGNNHSDRMEQSLASGSPIRASMITNPSLTASSTHSQTSACPLRTHLPRSAAVALDVFDTSPPLLTARRDSSTPRYPPLLNLIVCRPLREDSLTDQTPRRQPVDTLHDNVDARHNTSYVRCWRSPHINTSNHYSLHMYR